MVLARPPVKRKDANHMTDPVGDEARNGYLRNGNFHLRWIKCDERGLLHLLLLELDHLDCLESAWYLR